VGFPQIVERLPTIQVALFRHLQNGAPVEIQDLKPETQLDEALHGTLVRLEGQALRHFSHGAQEWLNVQFGQRVVDVNLEKSSTADELNQIEPGSVVRCTGVYLAQFDQAGKLPSFRILLRSKADAMVLSRPGWWTTQRMLWALGASAAALLLALGWAKSLRKQVQQSTRELAYERDLLKALLESYPDAIYFKDLEGRFVRLSKSKVERAFGIARERCLSAKGSNGNGAELPEHLRSLEAFSEYMVGKTDREFFEKARAQSAFEDEQEIIRTGQPLLEKIERAALPDGKICWALSTKMPWRDPQGKIIGTFGISKDITSIKEAEVKLESFHRQFVETSRQAGMAEVASSVLHNVGNVLNSVNVTTNLLHESLQKSRLPSLSKVIDLMHEHEADLDQFITKDVRGRNLPHYLQQLNEQLITEQRTMRHELECLARNMDHIKSIVAMQQSYAKVSGITERAQASELVEDALRFNAGALDRHRIDIQRDFAPNLPELTVDRHRCFKSS
jgi:PAS domain-containing protein